MPKKMASQLLKTHEKLHTTLLREHGLARRSMQEENEGEVVGKIDEEKDITLTLAEPVIRLLDSRRKNDLASAVKAIDSVLDDYLKIARQRASLATLARRIKNWYEATSIIIFSLEEMVPAPPASEMSNVLMLGEKSSSGTTPATTSLGSLHSVPSSSSSSSSTIVSGTVSHRSLSSSLSHTIMGGEAKKSPPIPSSTEDMAQPKNSSTPNKLIG